MIELIYFNILMTEYNIFEIIKKEKKNIALIAPYNVNKIYTKYLNKYL